MSLQYIEDFSSSYASSSSSSSPASPSPPSPILTVQWATTNVVLTGHLDGTLCAFDANNGTLLAQIKAHTESLHSLTIDERGETALSSSIDSSASLWSLRELETKAASSKGAAQRIVPGEDGEELLTTSEPSSMDLQPIKSITAILDTEGQPLDLPTAALHPSGRFFAAAGSGAVLSLHSAGQADFGELLCSNPYEPASSAAPPPSVYALSFAFSPSGKYVAMGTDFGHVHLFSIVQSSSSSPPTLSRVALYTSHALPIRSLAFDSSSTGGDNHLFVGSDDRLVTLYDVASLSSLGSSSSSGSALKILTNPVSFLQGHKGSIDHLAPVPVASTSYMRKHNSANSSRAGKSRPPLLLATTSVQDGFIRLWDLDQRPKRSVCVIRAGGDVTTAAATAPSALPNGDSVESNGEVNGEAPGQSTTTTTTASSSSSSAPSSMGPRGATSLAWRPLPLSRDSDAGFEAATAAGSAFVAGGTDGVLRWYRASGTGGDL
ncbi:WD40 repeat-like protein [Microstroma glucosiphilum]|uniref:WD40 repeat-like protein n=1 Tax=Pseudomicrostroma glucosiphilum TaxID=1684307 RepID=A0A316U6M3_9BASI|nr:WD40 repeat-like protein [Pseudomicrostroma glucosiphilum]PWN20474.1 WD40 repeat-like protein [Pseudomicrostroma glucosiphilum]